MPSARLFVAVPVPAGQEERLRAHVSAAAEAAGLHLPGSPVPSGNMHLTLRFLGDTPPDQQTALEEALAHQEFGTAFAAAFADLGAFPRAQRARVLWIGFGDGSAGLADLARAVEEAARGVGFAPEARPFNAHLTLARVRPEEDVTELLAAVPAFPEHLAVDRVQLVESFLGPKGSRYETRAEMLLDLT